MFSSNYHDMLLSIANNTPGSKENSIKYKLILPNVSMEDPFGKRSYLRGTRKDLNIEIECSLTGEQVDDIRCIAEVTCTIIGKLTEHSDSWETPAVAKATIKMGGWDEASAYYQTGIDPAADYGRRWSGGIHVKNGTKETPKPKQEPKSSAARATGKTTKRLLNALFLLSNGKNVEFIANDRNAAKYLTGLADDLMATMGWPHDIRSNSITLEPNGKRINFVSSKVIISPLTLPEGSVTIRDVD